ncbi:UbiX family flavin prenyltransferase [Paenibacillus mucilaginosus]|uniref:Flavin prenyltransferase UbiX n=1 Tax=Paenibacillus mucilaginosus (strain KNP414) TaxID=1036673 RepID=F8FAU2_PAEMK|nr:flavin prenyltransferase UbiX [Paenibacillus mucilaginosus]AEI41343.1 Probable aromatic acid decarboxylase [Paenibacillus mucilaginosus KNP414]MCG7211236.1 UbiX family flavin prenyltransferase [Paenibacillus mucilaginosus]WDM30370.1 UbiX family flavin prenyltransferase [Paenibacillus mucilaginosus]
MSRPWVVGITGASGAAYGVRLCRFLLEAGEDIHLVVTDAGWRVLKEELGWDVSRRKETLEEQFAPGQTTGRLEYVPNQDIGAKTASGSFRTQGMVVVPCSMGTLSGIAHGASDNLLERTADVMLKEGRKLILVPRETPLHAIHLENMLKLARLGVRIIPAMPAFYQGPQTVDDLIDFMVGKILDCMEINHELYRRWGSPQ